MKKFLTIVVVILIALGIIWGLWHFLFRNDGSSVNDQANGDIQNFFPTTNRDSINPLGDTNTDGSPIDSDIDGNINVVDGGSRAEIPRMRQLSTEPVAGMIAFERVTTTTDVFINELGAEESPTSSEIIFRYMERGTGHLYETKENSLTRTRLSNTTVPKVYNAIFSDNGEGIVLRYLDIDNETIKTFAADIVENQDSALDDVEFTIEGRFLPDNINDFTAAPNGNNVLYLLKNQLTTDTGVYIADLEADVTTLIYDTPISQWLSQWINESSIGLTTRPHSKVTGYSFLIDTENRELIKTIEAREGLTTLYNQAGSHILYTYSDGRSFKSKVREVQDNLDLDLRINTLPEKCAWDPSRENILYCAAPNVIPRGDYPEDWYKGAVTFNDNIWRINIATRDVRQVYRSFDEVDEAFDMIRPIVSPDGEYFLFVNKKDLTLWSYDLQLEFGGR